jgi:predicted metal-dependent enzyme (double-stranded beta helix superfamily)
MVKREKHYSVEPTIDPIPGLQRSRRSARSINTKGHVTVLGNRGIHRVDNISGKPTTSIHVYGRDIGHTERQSYDPVTGEIGRLVSGYCNVLRDTERF